MINHYRLPPDRPVAIQFSGGRTSGYMLYHILKAHEGRLPPDAHVLFQNTGREMPETLDFVQAVANHWGVRVRWLEFIREKPLFQEVGHNSAARNGEPFEAIIAQRKYLPNVVTRFCTEVLKVRTARRFLISQGYKRWTAVIGFRADETSRVIKLLAKPRPRERAFLPLFAAGVTKLMVSDFWKAQPFNLALTDVKGKTPEGNCDGCFLKGEANNAYLARYHPERAAWWAEQERRLLEITGEKKTFVKDRAWADLQKSVGNQPDWIFDTEQADKVYCDTSFGGCHDE